MNIVKTLTGWTNWIRSSPRDEWDSWKNWQQGQLSSHFERSDIFQHYLSMRQNFKPPDGSCIFTENSKYYIYCFGDFAPLIMNTSIDLFEYIIILLDIYDTCKGYLRRMIGEHPCITAMRNTVITKCISEIYNYDYSQYLYPYDTIHAHTVAQYSLSTLIMRFLHHFIGKSVDRCYYNISHEGISLRLCKNAYYNNIFGKAVEYTDYYQCKTCMRLTETVLGNFHVCVDCHFKRICSVCGAVACMITNDNLPKCILHEHS